MSAQEFTIIKGEDRTFTIALRDKESGDPIDLTGATARAEFANADGAKIVRSSDGNSFQDANVSVDNDRLAIPNHGYVTDDVVQLTSTGTLPGGLALATNYYVRRYSKDAIELALTAGGAKVDITSASGGGVHTVSGVGLLVANPPTNGKLQLTVGAQASAQLKAGLRQIIEVEYVKAGKRRIVQLTRRLNVIEQAY